MTSEEEALLQPEGTSQMGQPPEAEASKAPIPETELPTEQPTVRSLPLTSDQMAKIASVARDNKFEIRAQQLIYADDPIVRLEGFLKSYRFVFNVNETLDVGNADYAVIKAVLDEFINTLKDRYHEALRLYDKFKLATNYNAFRIRKNISTFLITNQEDIDRLVDFVQPLGRVTKQYNPSDVVGLY